MYIQYIYIVRICWLVMTNFILRFFKKESQVKQNRKLVLLFLQILLYHLVFPSAQRLQINFLKHLIVFTIIIK